jgi:hypothetical protein
MVARGYPGPVAMGGKERNARWYFLHPEEAAAVVSASNIIERQVGKVTNFIDKYLSWLDEAYAVGKIAYDLYQSKGDGNFDISSIDARDVQELFGRFIDKGRVLVESQAAKYARELKEKLDMGGVAQAYAEVIKVKKQVAAKQKKEKFLKSVPKLNQAAVTAAGNILTRGGIVRLAGLNYSPSFGKVDVQAFLGEWQPAEIGLRARQRWNNIVFAWANMTTAERNKIYLNEDDNWQTWSSKGINWNGQESVPCGDGRRSWVDVLTKDPDALAAIYNIQLPSLYVSWLVDALARVERASNADKINMRRGSNKRGLGATSTSSLPNPYNWSFRIPETLVPSLRDISGKGRGWPATPEQYALWVADQRDIYDPRRWEAAFNEAKNDWEYGLRGSTDSWRKDASTGAGNPPLVWKAPVLAELQKSELSFKGVSIPVFGTGASGGYMTYKSFWSAVMDAAGVASKIEGLGLNKLSIQNAGNYALGLGARGSIPPISGAVLNAAGRAALNVARIAAEEPEPTLAVGGEGVVSSSVLWWVLGGIGVAALLRWRLAND